ncbi:ABC transporter ATP-binding protein [Cohnella sp. 56]|uniref:ABC transporter ATP-binding protein n=1 Tax=Cohnella sp. 56 TaxID=3113722 RepID=UPI0030E84204
MFERRGRPDPGAEKARAHNAGATIRRLWGYLGRQRAGLAVAIALILLSTAASLAGPYLLGRAVDSYIIPREWDGLARLCWTLLAVYALGSLASWLQAYVMAGVSQRTVWALREDLFAHVQKLPLRFFDRTPHGELMSKTTNDVENVSVTLNQSFVQIAASALTLSGALVLMLWLNVWLTLVTLATAPLVVLVAKTIGKRSKRYFKAQQQALGELNGFVEETVSGQKAVKLLRREPAAIARFAAHSAELRAVGTRAQILSGTIGPGMNMMGHFSFILIAATGGWMAWHDWTRIGVIVAFLSYSRQFTWPLNELANQYNAIQAAVAGAERVFEVMDTETEYEGEKKSSERPQLASGIRDDEAHGDFGADSGSGRAEGSDTRPAPVVRPNRAEGSDDRPAAADGSRPNGGSETTSVSRVLDAVPRGHVVFDDVSFGYNGPGEPTLKRISFAAEPGHTVALVGPTGAGKTTVINLLTRFYDIDEGRIAVDGQDIAAVPKDALRSRLGIVLQDAYLFTGTIADNIRYGRPDASDLDVREAARLARADGFIERLPQRYDTPMTSAGGNLSHGQRQLITIARAILADPDILILDEATSSVDTRTEMHIQEAMNALMKGRTSFVIAHRLNTVRHADLILVVDGGEIVERGTHEQLVERGGAYARLYNSQFRRAI